MKGDLQGIMQNIEIDHIFVSTNQNQSQRMKPIEFSTIFRYKRIPWFRIEDQT